MALADGFPGERFEIVPRPVVVDALARPVTRRLVVTDAGYFPVAAGHARSREAGAHEDIVLVCVAGAGSVHVDGAEFAVTPGCAVLLPRGLPHSYRAVAGDPWTIWWAHLRGSDVPELAAATGAGASRPVLVLRQSDRAVALLDEIVGHLERGHGPAHLIGATGAAWKLFTQLATDQLLPERGDPVERAMAYLADRLDSPVRVDDLASLVGVSSSHLGALFRRATGGGVLAYQTSLRMTRARSLLDRTGMPVAEVARTVGYDDPLYFSRHFRDRHGVSPTEYRATTKG
jgi:AraC family transcriptional regulator of arabinose operon